MACPSMRSRRPGVCQVQPFRIHVGSQGSKHRRARHNRCFAASNSMNDDTDNQRQMLQRMLDATASTANLSGKELRQLIWEKWGKHFDVRLQQRGGRTYVHIMWRFLEQKSFPLTEDEYQQQLDAVAGLCREWGVSDIVRDGIKCASERGPGLSQGNAGKAVSIPLGKGLDMMGGGR